MSSTFEEDLERGYLADGAPLEDKWGRGFWSEPEPYEPDWSDPDILIPFLEAELDRLKDESVKMKAEVDALQARAERAEATIADCLDMFNEVNLLDGETDLRDVVNDVIDLFLFWKTACEMQNQAVELLDGWVERFIEFGTPLADIARAVNYGNEIELLAEHINNWDKLVTEWKERKDETD